MGGYCYQEILGGFLGLHRRWWSFDLLSGDFERLPYLVVSIPIAREQLVFASRKVIFRSNKSMNHEQL